MNFWHKLFNPHCEHCQEIDRESRHCVTCDVLGTELASVKQERDRLLSRILNPIIENVSHDSDELKPISPRSVPWNVRRQMLEAEDREKARLLKNAPKPVEELEKEVLGS